MQAYFTLASVTTTFPSRQGRNSASTNRSTADASASTHLASHPWQELHSASRWLSSTEQPCKEHHKPSLLASPLLQELHPESSIRADSQRKTLKTALNTPLGQEFHPASDKVPLQGQQYHHRR
jgi:hypothetical protein